jgi:ArsR family transcriptional regulator, arsenate/arsenite/antimonite-responsive transcriptional repressor / arsenate reductase (thioredoxin)
MDFDSRVCVHQALADRHRLAIVDALVFGDRTPQELSELAEIPTNLMAHHLHVLEQAGLIERHVSSGDKRRRYVVVNQERVSQIVPHLTVPAGCVLFVCTHNSARSPFAAALWRAKTGGQADCAGTDPAARVDPVAIATAERFGVDLSTAVPKGYDAVDDAPALLISVCDRAREAGLPYDVPSLHWSVPDPGADGRPVAFTEAFADISGRVERLAVALADR